MKEPMYQVSTLQALARGDYYGNSSIGELLEKGDTGLGTFMAVDGEMIVIEGKCFRAKADGSVQQVDASEYTPFANVTFFNRDISIQLTQEINMVQLIQKLDEKVRIAGINNIYACRIDGSFNQVYVRSEKKQNEEPYKPFAQVLAVDQREFEYKDVSGSLIGVYFPQYLDGLNAAGWHLHFISDDRTKGGHVFGLKIKVGTGWLCKTDGFRLLIPDSDYFNALNLTEVSQEEIASVEKISK